MAKNNEKFVSRENAKTLWGYMVDLLTGKYTKPSGGIPKSDLESSVQTSLGKADTALQSFEETDPTVPSWAKATNKPSYTQDEVGDGTTYKRVSSTEKDIWNAKGTYSKPSGGIPKSDLASAVQTSLEKADSALQSYTETDPTVPSWAKQTSKPSYNSDEISDTNRTHKFATQSQLNQISTNQTNILYTLQTGAKNLLKIKYCDYVNIASISNMGIVSITTSAKSEAQDIHLANIPAEINKFVPMPSDWVGKYFSGIITGNSGVTLYMEFSNNGVSWAAELAMSTSGQKIVIPNYAYYKLTIKVTGGTALSNYTVIPMVADEVVYNTVGVGQPQSLPNSDLTYLEAEDRAALAEEIDAGAKNKFDLPSLETLKASNSSGTWSNNVYTLNNVTFTVDTTNKTISTSGTASAQTTFIIESINPASTKYSGLILSGCPSGGNYDTGYSLYTTGTSSSTLESDTGEGVLIGTTAIRYVGILCRNGTNMSGKVFKPMICTKAAFGVSNKFVPYRPNYDLVQFMLPKSKTVDFTVTSADTYQTVEDLKVAIPSGYAIRVTTSAWRNNSITPTGIRILTATSSAELGNGYLVSATENPVVDQLALSATGAIKNIGAETLYSYIQVKFPSTGTYKVTIFYDMVTGTRTN